MTLDTRFTVAFDEIPEMDELMEYSEELGIEAEPPRIYYGFETNHRGAHYSKHVWIGSELPETFVSPEKDDGDLYPVAQAFGWTKEEAKRKLEEALGERL